MKLPTGLFLSGLEAKKDLVSTKADKQFTEKSVELVNIKKKIENLFLKS